MGFKEYYLKESHCYNSRLSYSWNIFDANNNTLSQKNDKSAI